MMKLVKLTFVFIIIYVLFQNAETVKTIVNQITQTFRKGVSSLTDSQ